MCILYRWDKSLIANVLKYFFTKEYDLLTLSALDKTDSY